MRGTPASHHFGSTSGMQRTVLLRQIRIQAPDHDWWGCAERIDQFLHHVVQSIFCSLA